MKVGFTRDLPGRLVQLQIGNPRWLRVLALAPGADSHTEAAFHAEFDEQRLRGEWFALEGPVLRVVDRYRLREPITLKPATAQKPRKAWVWRKRERLPEL